MRLIATDLDGTLLGSDEGVSARNLRALRAAREAGVAVVLVTGRPPRWVRGLARELDLGTPAICANGAIVYDAEAGRILEHRPMAPELACEIVTTLRRAVPGVQFAFEMGLVFGHEPSYRPLTSRPMPEEMRVGDALELAGQPVTKVLARHDERDAAGLAEALGEALRRRSEPTWSTPYLLEIAAAGIDKGRALAGICRGMGIPAESVVAFGDMPNDLSMLRWAGIGVAMGNADPRVTACAERIAERNDRDGVARVIEELLELPGSRSAKS